MIVFRSPRLHGRARLRVRKLGLTDREVADMLAPRPNGVEVAPVDPPVDCKHGFRAAGGAGECPLCVFEEFDGGAAA